DSESLDRCIQSALSALYPPFQATSSTVLCQVLNVVESCYQGDGLRYLIHFLLPSKHFLQNLQQDACLPYCGLLFRHEGWPLCVHEKVVVQLCRLDQRLLRPGDFYLLVSPPPPPPPPQARGTSRRSGVSSSPRLLACSLSAGGRHAEELEVSELALRSLFSMAWLDSVNREREKRGASRLERCLLSAHGDVFRVPWEDLVYPQFISRPKAPRREDKEASAKEGDVLIDTSEDRREDRNSRSEEAKLLPSRQRSDRSPASSEESDSEGEYVELVDVPLPRFSPQKGSLTQSISLQHRARTATHTSAADTHTPQTTHTHTAADTHTPQTTHTHTAADTHTPQTTHTHTAADTHTPQTTHTHTAADTHTPQTTHTHTAADTHTPRPAPSRGPASQPGVDSSSHTRLCSRLIEENLHHDSYRPVILTPITPASPASSSAPPVARGVSGGLAERWTSLDRMEGTESARSLSPQTEPENCMEQREEGKEEVEEEREEEEGELEEEEEEGERKKEGKLEERQGRKDEIVVPNTHTVEEGGEEVEDERGEEVGELEEAQGRRDVAPVGMEGKRDEVLVPHTHTAEEGGEVEEEREEEEEEGGEEVEEKGGEEVEEEEGEEGGEEVEVEEEVQVIIVQQSQERRDESHSERGGERETHTHTEADTHSNTHTEDCHTPHTHTEESNTPHTHSEESNTPHTHSEESNTPHTHSEDSHTPHTHSEESNTPHTHSEESNTPHTHSEESNTPHTHSGDSHTPHTHSEDSHTPHTHSGDSHTPHTHSEDSHTPHTHSEESNTPHTHSEDSHTPHTHSEDSHTPHTHSEESNTPQSISSPAMDPHTPWAEAKAPGQKKEEEEKDEEKEQEEEEQERGGGEVGGGRAAELHTEGSSSEQPLSTGTSPTEPAQPAASPQLDQSADPTVPLQSHQSHQSSQSLRSHQSSQSSKSSQSHQSTQSSQSSRSSQSHQSSFNSVLLSSGALCLPGSRDRMGRAVVTVCSRSSVWLKPGCDAAELLRILLYFTSTLRREVRALGLTVLVDARRSPPVPALFNAFRSLQENMPGCIHTVLLLADKDVAQRLDKPPATQVEVLSSLKSVQKHVELCQLPAEFGGSFSFSQSSWLCFRSRVEQLTNQCEDVINFLQKTISILESTPLPPAAEEAELLLSRYGAVMRSVLEDSRLVRLQQEGGASLSRLRREDSSISVTDDYRAAVEAVAALYDQVDELLHRLVRLSNSRTEELQFIMEFRSLEQGFSEVSLSTLSTLHRA
ncbi:filaggrin-2-like, partial [Centroberyx affinis]|uniref:filaggrin-2-like n=1 Tax=Centroberyx affinis TaxID=166261 RepID=UPI003A5C15AF